MITTREIAKAAGIAPRTKRFILRDADGSPYEGRRYDLVLAALSRSDKTPDLCTRARTVAYALRKSMISARMPAESENRIDSYTPYQICAVVARIANECPETTIGGICDEWIAKNHRTL